MQAIVTTYTSDECQRPVIEAQWTGKRARMPYDAALCLDDNHVQCALRLARQLGLAFDFVCARLACGDYCHVPVIDTSVFTSKAAASLKSPPEYFRGRPTPYGRA